MAEEPNFRSTNLIPPQNIEVEEAILGGILLDPEAIGRVAEKLIPEAFYTPTHVDIYKAALALNSQGKPTDLITLTDWLIDRKQLEKIGGQAKLIQLLERTVSAVNIDSLAVLVMDKYIRRELIKAGTEVTQLGYAADRPLETVLDESEQQILNLTQARPKLGLTPIREIVTSTYQDIQDRHDKVIPPGLTSDFSDLDGMTGGFQRSDLIIIAGRPAMGKCLVHDAEILLADGSISTIAEIYQKQQADLLTLDSDWKFHLTQPSAFIDDGIKPVFKVTTRLGRSIETTITHPYLTMQGWKQLAELKVGDKIAVPHILPIFGEKVLHEDKLKDSIAAVKLYREEYDSSIPSELFKLTRSQIAAIIVSLFDLDGSAAFSTSGRCGIYYSAASRILVRQIQHLLLRFGIVAEVELKPIEPDNHCKFGWRLYINDDRSARIFLKNFGIPGEVNREKPILTKHVSLEGLEDSDIYWDEITSIEYTGDKQVYDLTIPDTHNFIANDICVHNTAVSLNIAYNMAKLHGLPVLVFSLEMSKDQLVQRIIASEAGVDSNRLRSGRISPNEWDSVYKAVDRISELPIFIDDNASMTLMEMRSQARKKQAEHGGSLGLIMIDYLQLMEGTSDNRVQEISKITRGLKGLARELQVPVISLSQLSRGVEARNNKRPMMSDLRESGCLTGDTLITIADTGIQIPIRDLVGKSDFTVWALNEDTLQLQQAVVSHAFATGIKPVWKLQTQSGRTIRATANHKFLTIRGWKRLDEIDIDDRLATPRRDPAPNIKQSMSDAEIALLGHLIGDGCTLPRHSIQYTTRELDLAQIVSNLAIEIFGDSIVPRINQERDWYQVYLTAGFPLTHNVRNPITEWLDNLDVFGLRSHEKFVPDSIFSQPQAAISLFLRHLWSTDGCIYIGQNRCSPESSKSKHYLSIYYSSSSNKLAANVQSLLLRLEINATLRVVPQIDKGRDQYHVSVSGKPDMERFINLIGAVGKYKHESLSQIAEYLSTTSTITNRDVIPHEFWRMYAVPAMQTAGITTREFQAQLGNKYCGTSLYKANLSRERAAKISVITKSIEIENLANSDIYWDKIVSITPDGESDVYDLTVPQFHNFVANNIIAHNSIEQDADLIIMLYRDAYYNPDTVDRDITELIITKHRNGPTGVVKLVFDPALTKFKNLARPMN
jgi:replicative DNA helicase